MSDKEQNDPAMCPHGKRWFRCREVSCIKEMHLAEDQATCEHGFLIGCPTCTKTPLQDQLKGVNINN